LKPAAGAAGTQVIAPEFFHKFFFSMDDSMAALYFGFRRMALSALTAALESTVLR
jgi:hypothetical protein